VSQFFPVFPAKKVDNAAVVSAAGAKDLGGIDLNPDAVDIDVKRPSGSDGSSALSEKLWDVNIDGLVPVVIDIVPASVPAFLDQLS
jgi:hypothetical protein